MTANCHGYWHGQIGRYVAQTRRVPFYATFNYYVRLTIKMCNSLPLRKCLNIHTLTAKCYKLEIRRRRRKNLIVTLDTEYRQLFDYLFCVISVFVFVRMVDWQKHKINQLSWTQTTIRPIRNRFIESRAFQEFWCFIALTAQQQTNAHKWPLLLLREADEINYKIVIIVISSRFLFGARARTCKSEIPRFIVFFFSFVASRVVVIYQSFWFFLPDWMNSNNPSMKYIPNGSLIFTFVFNSSVFSSSSPSTSSCVVVVDGVQSKFWLSPRFSF